MNPGNHYRATFKDWEKRISRSVEAHYETAVKLRRQHYTLGIVALIFVTLLGSLKGFEPQNHNPIWSTIMYLMSTGAAVLVGLQTFLKYGERSEKHKDVASDYGMLRRRLEHLVRKSIDNKDTLEKEIDALIKDWDDLSKISPVANAKVWKKVLKIYDGGHWKSRMYLDEHEEKDTHTPSVSGMPE